MPIPDISEYNQSWGICGFTSALTHLYDSDSRLKSKIDKYGKDNDGIRLGLLVEVVTFLKYVKEFRKDLIDDLDKLNIALKSPSMTKGVLNFITVAEEAVRNQVKIGDSNDFQCALTPEALAIYLQEICAYKDAKLTMGSDPGGRGILGLYNASGELKHWVYRAANGTVYNWGKEISPEDWPTSPAGLGHPQLTRVGCHVSFG